MNKLTKWVIALVLINVLFAVSPLSFYGYYSDTVFLIFTFLLTAVTIVKRLRMKMRAATTIVFTLCLLVMIPFIYIDLDFRNWARVKKGTVRSLTLKNENSALLVTHVYYQLNSNNTVGPAESRMWLKKSIKYFPLMEWTEVDGAYDFYADIEELK